MVIKINNSKSIKLMTNFNLFLIYKLLKILFIICLYLMLNENDYIIIFLFY